MNIKYHDAFTVAHDIYNHVAHVFHCGHVFPCIPWIHCGHAAQSEHIIVDHNSVSVPCVYVTS